MSMQKKSAQLYWGLLVTAIFLFVVFSASEGLAAKKKKYDSWKGVAADMALEFDSAREDIEADRYRDAYKHVNDAYFGYYEVQGFEKNVMVAISSARVSHIEALFASIKHALLGNQEIAKDALLDMLESLRVKVYKDAMVLDGDIDAGEPDSLGEAVYGDKGRPAAGGGAVAAASVDTAAAVAEAPASAAPAPKAPAKAPVNRDWLTFLTAFGLLVREGLEAILVIVAIVAYLIKTGNTRMVRSVYVGSVAAIGASVLWPGPWSPSWGTPAASPGSSWRAGPCSWPWRSSSTSATGCSPRRTPRRGPTTSTKRSSSPSTGRAR